MIVNVLDEQGLLKDSNKVMSVTSGEYSPETTTGIAPVSLLISAHWPFKKLISN